MVDRNIQNSIKMDVPIGDTLLKVSQLIVLKDINLRLKRRDAWFSGMVGSGRLKLPKYCLSLKIMRGEIIFENEELSPKGPADVINKYLLDT